MTGLVLFSILYVQAYCLGYNVLQTRISSFFLCHFSLHLRKHFHVLLHISEREENVKADIFHAYVTLLRQTRPTVSSDPDAMEQEAG